MRITPIDAVSSDGSVWLVDGMVIYTPLVTVTLDLTTYTDLAAGGTVKFELIGQNTVVASTPYVLIPMPNITAVADDSGMVSQVLIRSSVIAPLGTSYQVTAFNNQGGWVFTKRYKINETGTVDLSSLTEL